MMKYQEIILIQLWERWKTNYLLKCESADHVDWPRELDRNTTVLIKDITSRLIWKLGIIIKTHRSRMVEQKHAQCGCKPETLTEDQCSLFALLNIKSFRLQTSLARRNLLQNEKVLSSSLFFHITRMRVVIVINVIVFHPPK